MRRPNLEGIVVLTEDNNGVDYLPTEWLRLPGKGRKHISKDSIC